MWTPTTKFLLKVKLLKDVMRNTLANCWRSFSIYLKRQKWDGFRHSPLFCWLAGVVDVSGTPVFVGVEGLVDTSDSLSIGGVGTLTYRVVIGDGDASGEGNVSAGAGVSAKCGFVSHLKHFLSEWQWETNTNHNIETNKQNIFMKELKNSWNWFCQK